MNHFDPEKTDDNGKREIASHYYPLTGPYDTNDEKILEYHALLMILSGIDGVLVDWYGMEDFWDYAILNQSPFKDLITVSQSNINAPVNVDIENVDDFADDNAKSALDKLFTVGNAVLTLIDNVVYVTNRDASSEVKYTFRGQASTFSEDILKISAAKNGLNRTFNYVKWGETTYFKQDSTSIEKYLQR